MILLMILGASCVFLAYEVLGIAVRDHIHAEQTAQLQKLYDDSQSSLNGFTFIKPEEGKPGLDLHWVKGEILYKFGKHFKKWNNTVAEFKSSVYSHLISAPDAAAQSKVSKEVVDFLEDQIRAIDELSTDFHQKEWLRRRNTQSAHSIIKSPIYGKQTTVEKIKSSTFPSESQLQAFSDLGYDFSKLRLSKVSWQHSDVLSSVQFTWIEEGSTRDPIVSPKVGQKYWTNGELQFDTQNGKQVRYINVKADNDYLYSMVLLDDEQKPILELYSRTTGGKWKTFALGPDETFIGFTETHDSGTLLTGLGFHKMKKYPA